MSYGDVRQYRNRVIRGPIRIAVTCPGCVSEGKPCVSCVSECRGAWSERLENDAPLLKARGWSWGHTKRELLVR